MQLFKYSGYQINDQIEMISSSLRRALTKKKKKRKVISY